MLHMVLKTKSDFLKTDDTQTIKQPYLSVVVPAYNEEHRLSVTLASMWRALRRRFQKFELIVVNDGSTDRTASVVEVFLRDHAEVRLINCPFNRGKGYAVRQGVLASSGRYVLMCDADQSTPIREVGKLLKALDQSDIAVGSRAIRESRIAQYQPTYRLLMGKTFNRFVQLLTVPGIHDTQCGFKCFGGDLARDIFARCKINGFCFDVELLYLARRSGLKIKEVGVYWKNSNESKVHPILHSAQMLCDLVKIRFLH